jgi:hypothetical protein
MNRFSSFCRTLKTPLLYYLNIDAAHPIKLDNKTKSDRLTTLESSKTPTLDNNKSPIIKALGAIQAAADDIVFNLVVARMPSDHRIKVQGIYYVLYDLYRPCKSKRRAWY